MARTRSRKKIAVGESYSVEIINRRKKSKYTRGSGRRILTMISIEMTMKRDGAPDLRPLLRDLMKQGIITSWRGGVEIAYRTRNPGGEWVDMRRHWAYCKYSKRKKAHAVITAAVRMMA